MDGKGNRLAEAHADACGEQRKQTHERSRRGDDGEQRPDQHAEAQNQLAAVAIGEAAAADLHEQVADVEGREDGALGRHIPAQIPGHRDNGDGDVYPIDVADEGGGEAHADHRVPRLPEAGRIGAGRGEPVSAVRHSSARVRCLVAALAAGDCGRELRIQRFVSAGAGFITKSGSSTCSRS